MDRFGMLVKFIKNIENNILKHSENLKNVIRNQILLIKSFIHEKQAVGSTDKMLIKWICVTRKFLKEHVIRTDKGNATVILNKYNYFENKDFTRGCYHIPSHQERSY